MDLTTLIIIIVILIAVIGIIYLLLKLLKTIAIILVIGLIIVAVIMVVTHADWGTSLDTVKETIGKIWDGIKHSDVVKEINDKIKKLIPGGD